MANKYTAVLIDTVSIQDYIFSSNRLKDNIGASSIVEQEIEKFVLQSLEEINKGASELSDWKTKPEAIQLNHSTACEAEIGYIGGGKIMLLFRKTETAKDFIHDVSLKLLASYPGVRTAFGIFENFDLNNFTDSQNSLAKNLAINKSLTFCHSTIPKHGITADCSFSGEVVEFRDEKEKEIQYISAVVKSKRNIAEKVYQSVNRELQKKHPQFLYPNELDDLGQNNERRYIAVVHVDGNNMGNRFIKCENLEELRKLSVQVSNKCENAFQKLIESVTQIFDENGFLTNNEIIDATFQLEEVKPKDKENFPQAKYYLPIRPIIRAGDDITFVCEGRLGVYLAEKLILLLDKEEDGMSIKSCAGVAVVKAKYPFAKAYNLAEELTKSAKTSSKEDDGANYLDFLISASGFSGSLDNIREQNFKNAKGDDLHFGPYRMDNEQDEKSFKYIKDSLKHFANKDENWPTSKIMELRNQLFLDKSDNDIFREECEASGRTLPKVGNNQYETYIIENKRSPYFEQIELMEFYPKLLLECNQRVCFTLK